jgi:hypothetical protein
MLRECETAIVINISKRDDRKCSTIIEKLLWFLQYIIFT